MITFPLDEARHNVIGGERCLGRGAAFETLYPATNEPIATLYCASNEDIEEALSAAHEAQKGWAATQPEDRAAILLKAATLLRENNDELAYLECLDTGRPISETSAVDVISGAEAFEFMAHAIVAQYGQYRDIAGAKFYTRREPLGVCLGIGAWNYPLQIACWKTAPALACGNAMIFKPSEVTPLTAARLGDVLAQAGLPAGVFTVLQGAGDVGGALASHPAINKVSLTGSVGTGKRVLQAAAANVTPVTLELGGKSPIIVFSDANIDAAATAVLLGNFYSQGQICSNGTRVFVHADIYEPFLDCLTAQSAALRMGSPTDPDVDFGPMINQGQAQKVLHYIETGKAEGATLAMGGAACTLDALPDAAFIEPTIFTHVTDEMTIAREEIFGPVMCLFDFKHEADVVRRANDTSFGLAAGVFTRDIGRAHRVCDQLQAGVCWVNDYNITPVSMPFGGMKTSGLGRENGIDGLLAYSQIKSVYINMAD